ncbi:hypothetical protein H9Q13_08955 [Pontibacter sp. JH31]|uniref:Uncharacterized protein n=1 Tax=Pontibacter aquaedesilientis TaxID=2766980 RepID=A0ABR7XH67_9BACT|nr:hypothetical protein [Pontibacter aquaedesilientis]MBD1397291.1 hypothetical protein [Pontibacter aquaedesilientis]
MKQRMRLKTAVLSIGMMLMALVSQGQDLIIKKNGDEVVAKIVKVGTDTVHYRMLSDASGPLRFVLRQDVAQMQLATEPSQTQLNQLPQVTTPDEYVVAAVGSPAGAAGNKHKADDLVYQARQDAMMYYKGQGPLWGTAGATFLFPPAGLVTGIVMAAVPPNVDATFHPNYQLMREPVYRQAFQKQAHKRKVGKAAAGFGIGFGALIALALAIGS